MTLKKSSFGKREEGHPAEGHPAEGSSAEDHLEERRPVEGRPVEGHPAEGHPVESRTAEGKPASSEKAGATVSQESSTQDVLAASSLAGSSRGKGLRGKKSRTSKVSGAALAEEKSAHAAKPKSGRQAAGSGRTKGRPALLWHDFATVFKQLLPFLLIAMGAYLVAMPVSTAAIPDTSVFNLDYTHDQMKFRFWADGLDTPIVLGACLFGAVLGVRAFRFMLVKREATAVLSLPMSRSSVFATRYLASLVCIVLGLGVPLAVSLIVNIVALDVWSGLFWSWGYVFAGLAISAALACAIAALACALAGTVAEAVSFAGALLLSVTAALWGLNAVMDWLLVGNPFGETLYSGSTEISPSLLVAFSFVNPLLFFLQEATDHQIFIVQHPVYEPEAGDVVLLGGWFVVTALLALLALVALRRCKGEKAGIAGLNAAVSVFVGIVVGMAAFGVAFTLLASLNVSAAIVAAFVVLWLVSLVLFRGPLRGRTGWRRTFAVMGIETVVVAACVVCVAFGGLGYAQAVPDTDEVQSVQISYTGSPSFLATTFESATAGEGSYYFSAEYSFDDAEAIDIVRSVHQQLIETGSSELGDDRLDFSQSVVPYDVVIRYTLSDGSEQVRYYDRATYDELAQLLELDGTQKGSELARAAVSGDVSTLDDDDAQSVAASSARQAFALGDIYVADRLYSTPMLVNCDSVARSELIAALAEDVAAQSVEDRYYPQSVCRGVLMFTQSGQSAAETFAYSIENTVVYLTDEYTNTLAWFEEKGLSQYLYVGDEQDDYEAEASAIESMTFQRYAPFEGMNAVTQPTSAYFMGYAASVDQQFIAMMDWGTKYSTDDATQIEELLPLCRNAYYLDGGGYLVSAKLAGQEKYAYLFIPADLAPEWLVRVAG